MKKNRSNVPDMPVIPPMPRSIPAINNQQPMFDVTQAVQKKCECGAENFDKIYTIRMVSKLAPGNRTQRDIIVEVPVYYVCRNCGEKLNLLDGKCGESKK
jgi:hypothetical protein